MDASTEPYAQAAAELHHCEWCTFACVQTQCQMMAGYAEAQMRERLAYANKTCSMYRTFDDRIIALALTRQTTTNTFQRIK